MPNHRPKYGCVVGILLFFICISGIKGGSLYPHDSYTIFLDRSYIAVVWQSTFYRGYSGQQTVQRFFPQNMGLQNNRNARAAHQPVTVLLINENSKDIITYAAYEIRGNLNIGKFVNFTFSVPFYRNEVYYKRVIESNGISQVRDTLFTYSGWGNVIGMMEYRFNMKSRGLDHTLRPAFGARIMKGTGVLNRYGQNVDQALLPGLLIPEYVLQLSYQLDVGKSGVHLFVAHGSTHPNKLGFRPGNTLSLQAKYQHRFYPHKIGLFPEIICGFQTAGADQLLGQRVEDSGRKRLMTGLGMEISRGRIQLRATGQKPVYEVLQGNQLHSTISFTSCIVYSF